MVTVKQIAIAGFLIAIASFALNAHYNWNLFQFTPGQMYQGCEVKSTADIALIPFYGYYFCEENTPDVVKGDYGVWNKIGFNSWDCPLKDIYETFISCPNTQAEVQQCNFKIDCQDSSFLGGCYGWWQVCSGSSCGNTAEFSLSYLQKQNLATLAKGQSVRVTACQALGQNVQNTKVYEEHIGYGLYQYERGNRATISTTSCTVPSSANQCIDCKLPDSEVGSGSGNPTIINNDPTGHLNPMQYSTYLKDWIYGPLKANFVSDIDGQLVDCSNRKVYSLDTIQTELGCAAFASRFKKSVDCCPGDTMPGKYCNDKFQWVSGDVGCCKAGICSVVSCDGQGGWYATGVGTNYRKANECTSAGECKYQEISAPCVPPNIGCNLGQSCQVDMNNPANNKCIGGGCCGDANKDCIDDCCYQKIPNCNTTCASEGVSPTVEKPCCEGLTPVQEWFGLVTTCQKLGFEIPWDIVFAVIAGALVFFKTGGVKNLKDGEYDALAISLIFALIIGIITWWVVGNWQTVAISLGILAILGSLGLYFFGGALLVIAFVLAELFKSVKGD